MLAGDEYKSMWRALLALAFFGGLRGSEYTVVTSKAAAAAPMIQNLQFVHEKGTMIMYYRVVQSKTNVHGMVIPYGCSGHDVCPVCSMKEYLDLRYKQGTVSKKECLFVYKSMVVTKSRVDEKIKWLVERIGMRPREYSTHSLRAGVASTAAQAGFKRLGGQKIGGWASQVYGTYIRDMNMHRAQFAKRLIRHATQNN